MFFLSFWKNLKTKQKWKAFYDVKTANFLKLFKKKVQNLLANTTTLYNTIYTGAHVLFFLLIKLTDVKLNFFRKTLKKNIILLQSNKNIDNC